MNLTELIENCHLDINQLDRDVICRVIRQNYTDKDIYNLIVVFLKGIDTTHTLNGELIHTLWAIGHWITEKKPLTNKQFYYVINNIIESWDQLTLNSRIELNL